MKQADTRPKKKNSPPRILITGLGCGLAAIMLALGFVIGGGAGLLYAPQLFQYEATATALNMTRIAQLDQASTQDAAARDIALRGTEYALAAQFTQAALNNNAALLEQTATQSARYVIATQTVQAANSARQMTQVALDYESTQVAFQENATQIAIDFQQTQAALGGSPEGQSLPAMPTAEAVFRSYSFAEGQIPDGWEGLREDWEWTSEGALAQADMAALLLSGTVMSDQYRFELAIQPTLADRADYYMLFGINPSGGLALRIQANGLEAKRIGLYEYNDATPPDLADLEPLDTGHAINIVLVGNTRLIMDVNGSALNVTINGSTALSTSVLQSPFGQIGVILPAGTLWTEAEISR
ncbi:MAG: hypothetical protein Kow0031_17240 [Anaerolineae bacterium]